MPPPAIAASAGNNRATIGPRHRSGWIKSTSWARCDGSRQVPKALRGFCPICGAFLFWKPLHKDKMSFALGAIDGPTRLEITRHIYTADKGDYYDIADDLPQS